MRVIEKPRFWHILCCKCAICVIARNYAETLSFQKISTPKKKKKGKYIKNVLATQKHSSARKALFVDDIEHTICLMDILKYLQQQHL